MTQSHRCDWLQSKAFNPIQAGTLKVFLAQTVDEIQEAECLRYDIFSEEMGACLPNPREARGFNPLDQIYKHLIVQDITTNKIVGTYRLAGRQEAHRMGSFLTESEYDLSRLLKQPVELLELSRACVAPSYRTLSTLTLLWRGLAEYVLLNDITYFFGCASFPGLDPSLFSHALSYLAYTHLAPESFRPIVLPNTGREMRILPRDTVDSHKAIKEMPPLVKGYVRLGCFVGDGFFIDKKFNTTDICIVVKTDVLKKRYAHYFNSRSQQTKRFFVL